MASPADNVRRLLLSSTEGTIRTSRQLVRKLLPEPILGGFVPQTSTDELQWGERWGRWARWACATTQEVSNVKPFSGCDAASDGRGDKAAVYERREHNASATEQMQQPIKGAKHWQDLSFWSPRPVTQTYISFGQILHETSATISPGLTSVRAIPWSVSRAFSPALPSLSALFSTIEASTTLPAGSIRMRFEPSPWQMGSSHPDKVLPAVEMRFSVDSETKSIELQEMLAISDITSTDVMLPDRALDLRFEQKTMYRDNGDLLSKTQVQDFIQASQLDLEHGQLQTPPRITLPIPAAICKNMSPGQTNDKEVHTVEVEYLFTGLDYRSTLHYEFDGWALLYTSIEGGKAGGRRGELKLYPSSKQGATLQAQAGLQDDHCARYIEAAYRLVDTLETKIDPAKHLELLRLSKVEDRIIVPIKRGPIEACLSSEDCYHHLQYFNKSIDLDVGDQTETNKTRIKLGADDVNVGTELGAGQPDEAGKCELDRP